MKRWKIALLLTLAVVVLALGGIGLCQRDNIRAAYVALTRDTTEIVAEMDTVRETFRETIETQLQEEVVVQLPSAAQSEAIFNGDVTAEEIKEALGVEQMLPKPPVDPPEPEPEPLPEPTPPDVPADPGTETTPDPIPAPDPTPQPVPEPEPVPTAQELVNQCIAELTVRQVELMEQLGAMKQAAVDEWVALPEAERTADRKKEIGLAGLDACYELELVVDDEVRAILDHYETELTAIGADLSVLETIWNYYESEKATQKAYYLNKYLD